MHKKSGSEKAVKVFPIRRHSLRFNPKRAQLGLDKKKTWLIFGISVLVLIALVLVLYSPAREALFGEAIESITCPYICMADGTCTEECGSTVGCDPDPDCVEICDNNIDDDSDGWIDCDDYDCDLNKLCQETVPLQPLEPTKPLEPIVIEICDDEIDNDGDGAIDCDDSSCACAAYTDNDQDTLLEICDDELDNDQDSLIDCADPDCDSQSCGVYQLCINSLCVSECPPGTVPYNQRCMSDTDADYIADEVDNCPSTANPDQLDTNGDGVGDACEVVAILGDSDANGCLFVTEYNDFKYEYKNGLLPDVTVTQYNDLKYEFKNNVGSIVCP